MDALTHTFLAVAALVVFYFAGEYSGKKRISSNKVEDVVDHTLSMLEREDFIRTETDKDGDRELIPISEVVAEALRDAKT